MIKLLKKHSQIFLAVTFIIFSLATLCLAIKSLTYYPLIIKFSKYDNAKILSLSKSELSDYKKQLENFNFTQLLLSFFIALQIPFVVNNIPSRLQAFIKQFKKLCKNNIIVFEYLFFGQLSISMIRNNNFIPQVTNQFLFVISIILVIFGLSQINFKGINNLLIKFLTTFSFVFISFLIIDSSL